MKVGIITWYGVTNYGAALQAYALQTLIEASGNECEILRHPVHESLPNTNSLGEKIRHLRQLSPGRSAARRGETSKSQAVADFRARHLHVTNKYFGECEIDLAIIGSDEMFSLSNFNDFVYGIGVSAQQVATYAPSFAQTSLTDLRASDHWRVIPNAISRMTHLSARDVHSQRVLEAIAKREVSLVLDPTLVYDFALEDETWLSNPPFDRYVVIYTWGGESTSTTFKKAAIRFAKAHGLRTVSIGDTRSWCDLNMHGASPIDFFSVVSQATAVITNMFHGTCFALRARVPVLPIVMPHCENKLGDLLERSGMAEWRLDSVAALTEAAIPEINYEQVEEKLGAERTASSKYLNGILGV